MDLKLKRLILRSAVFAFSLSLSWWLVREGFFNSFVSAVLPLKFVAEFIAGIFYVSFLTFPLSIAMLISLADVNNPIITALLAGLGSAFADLLIVKFFKEKLSKDVDLISRELQLKKVNNFLVKWKIDFLTPLIGAIIVASPLPDEFGLILLGASKLSYRELSVLTYILNTAGILIVVVPANLLL